jgi:hypothetical protein
MQKREYIEKEQHDARGRGSKLDTSGKKSDNINNNAASKQNK